MKTFWELLESSFVNHATRPAVEFSQRSYSFSELRQSMERVAAVLNSHGVALGDRVVLYLESKEPYLLGYLGCLRCGAVPLPINAVSKLAELTYFVNDSGASAIIYDAATESVVRSLGTSSGRLALISAEQVLQSDRSRPMPPVSPEPDDPALMLYSSGTTGEPKGVVHSHVGVANAVSALAETWRFTRDDVLVNVLPLFHIHGLSFATNVSLVTGSSMIVGDRFHPVQTLSLIERSTVFMGVPPYYYSFLKRPEFAERAARWGRLRLVTCGSAPIRSEVLPQLESILNRPVINRYGMTECHVLSSLPLDGPWPHGSVGVALRGIELALRGNAGSECGLGEDGRVWARGPNLFRGYWNRPAATSESFDAAGWFDTGDIGRLDPAGFLTLVGRSKDLIIVGGFNVYPAVIERVLNDFPGVRESAVAGMADDARGERVAAFVVCDGPPIDLKGLRAFCRDRLSDYQCPTHIEFVQELPRNSLGKVLRRELVPGGRVEREAK